MLGSMLHTFKLQKTPGRTFYEEARHWGSHMLIQIPVELGCEPCASDSKAHVIN